MKPWEQYQQADGPWKQYQTAQEPERTWSDVPGEAVSNLLPSAGQFASGVYQAVRHPVDTAGSLFKAGMGAVGNLLPESMQGQSTAQIEARNTADAVGQFYKNRYGSAEGIKNALATDPVGVASDLSALLSGGAALAPKASKLAQVLKSGAKLTNPMTPVAGAIDAGSNTGNVVARKLMQSAVKPTIEQLRKGEAQTAISTLLKYGISPTEKGVQKIRGLVDDLNSQIGEKIAGSNAVVNKSDVLNSLTDTAKRFANQVSPQSDLNAIAGVADDFVNHPGFPGKDLPVQAAQALKQGTYKSLSGKYGEIGSASTEAQKALARGLKEQIGKAVPDVVPLNAAESDLLKTLKVTERRALMDLNKNPVGLSALANNPSMFAMFMADRSAAFKGLVARMINRASQVNKPLNYTADALRSVGIDPLTATNIASQAGMVQQR